MPNDPLTHEEHEARAMLLGMRYHHGNGEPVYYFVLDGMPDVTTFIDANTLEPLLVTHKQGPHDEIISTMKPAGRRVHAIMCEERLAEREQRVLRRKRNNEDQS